MPSVFRAAAMLATAYVTVAGGCGGAVARDASLPPPRFSRSLIPSAVDRVDILFMIDNSTSMGDAQTLLAQAVPDLVTRLVNPNCLDAMGNTTGRSSGTPASCPTGQQLEFPPVHDMHIGVVSSSLGGRGSDACPASSLDPANPSLSAHNDDQGHLLNRSDPMLEGVENPVPDEGEEDFLAWLPSGNPSNDGKAPPPNGVVAVGEANHQFLTDFTELVTGVHPFGCGFGAQTESWYRFLVQPDPYQAIVVNGGRAELQGVDPVILHDGAWRRHAAGTPRVRPHPGPAQGLRERLVRHVASPGLVLRRSWRGYGVSASDLLLAGRLPIIGRHGELPMPLRRSRALSRTDAG